ncbi:MAG: tRNA threonylcarbamoyladenosine dehydratase [Oscillospiraceae bacterium]|nr:tRNA threonylcarbamoyladenosine dehydratase [Oscillospiraceae bacterium]
MAEEQFSRLAMMVGDEGITRLKNARVAVFGVGGVGGYVVEALARSGIGTLDLIDHDTVSISNLNRQILALHSTIGQRKVDVAAERIHDISPDTSVNAYPCFYLPETAAQFDFSQYDYVVDAIDTVKGKIEIIIQAQSCGVPVISSMGTGNKLEPSMLRIADIYQTNTCPLARVMRYELRKRGIKKLKVLFSEETPIVPVNAEKNKHGKTTPASNAFVPATAGLLIAGAVINDLIKTEVRPSKA